MGAVTGVTITSRTKNFGQQILSGYCHMSSSYSSGGDTLSPSQLGLTAISELIVMNSQASGYVSGYNGLSSGSARIQCYVCSTGVELSGNGAQLPGRIYFKVFGY